MAKTIGFYVVETKEGDTFCISDVSGKLIGKDRAGIEEYCKGGGKWLEMTLRPATASLDRQITAKSLVANELSGFRQDPLLMPGARFEALVESWWKDKPATAADFDAFPPNLADNVDYCLQKHLRPNMTDDPDFFTEPKGNSQA